jgi:hypothetical protein
MFELILAIFVIPKTISPVAKAAGRSVVLWNVFSIGVFLITEILIVAAYYITYELLAERFRLKQSAHHFWAASFVYVIALISGLLSVDVIRRYLSREPSSDNNAPPPPTFS